LTWAAGAGLLRPWLERGVAIVDQQERMGGTVGRYALNADTLADTFLECLEGVDRHAALAAMREDPAARALDSFRGRLPPLALVGRFLGGLGDALAAEMQQHPRSRFVAGVRVRALHLRADGTIAADLADDFGRRRTLQAASAVLALGGRQQTDWRAIALRPGLTLARWRHKIIPSDHLLTRDGALAAAERLAGRRGSPPRAAILGGSHSAFSAAWMLLERLPRIAFGDGGVSVLYRAAPRVFYPTRAAATADSCAFMESDVCPATGRVHRLGGLRGDGREMWRRMRSLDGEPAETRAVARPIESLDTGELAAQLDAANLIVPAFGYRLATVPVFAAQGGRVRLADAGPSVDADARLRTADGGVLPNVFGIGLGSGFRPWGLMAGEPGFRGQQNSLWLYQHGLGALIHDNVRRWAAERCDRAAEIARLDHASGLLTLRGAA